MSRVFDKVRDAITNGAKNVKIAQLKLKVIDRHSHQIPLADDEFFYFEKCGIRYKLYRDGILQAIIKDAAFMLKVVDVCIDKDTIILYY